MKHTLSLTVVAFMALFATSCSFPIDQNISEVKNLEKLDWRYEACDIKTQINQTLTTLMDRWVIKTGLDAQKNRLNFIVGPIDNRTDTYISNDIIREIFEEAAENDGRFTLVVKDIFNSAELDIFSEESIKPQTDLKAAPEFLIKVRLTKTDLWQPDYTIVDYRVTVTMYNVENQEVIDSCCHVLSKKLDH